MSRMFKLLWYLVLVLFSSRQLPSSITQNAQAGDYPQEALLNAPGLVYRPLGPLKGTSLDRQCVERGLMMVVSGLPSGHQTHTLTNWDEQLPSVWCLGSWNRGC